MNVILALLKRNIKLFFRDKAAVFFSFLSTLILVALYFLFIAKIYTEGMDSPEMGGIPMPLGASAKDFIVYLQMMAGVLILNSMSLATGTFATIARDFENKHIDNFLLTPAKTHEIIISYFAAGLIVSFVMNVFTWALTYFIIGAATGHWVAAGTFFMVVLVLFIASLISCSLMLLVTALVKSSAAIGVMNGILGTFFGFLCGIYMPYGNLGEGTKAVGSFLPFSHLVIWLKRTVLDDAFSQLGIAGAFKDILYRDYFTAESIGFCGLPAPLWLMVFASGLFGLVCMAVSYVLLAGRIRGSTH